MSGDSTTTGSTTTSTVPGLEDLLGYAQSIAESGTAWQPYTSSMVTPYSDQTMTGLQGAEENAHWAQPMFDQQLSNIWGLVQGNGLSDLQNDQVSQWQGIASGNGLNAEQQKAYDALTPTANGMSAEQQSIYNALKPTASGLNTMQEQAAGYLNPIAGGSQMTGNPYLEDMIKKSSEDIRYSSELGASGMGRYGSGGHEGVTAKAIGDMSTDLRYQNYTDEAARRDAAIRDYFGMGTTGNTQRTSALGQQGDLATTGQTQRANALNSQFGMGTTGATQAMDASKSIYGAGQQQLDNMTGLTQSLTDAYNASLAPYQTYLGIGGAYEDLYSAQLADQQRIYEESQAAETDPLDWLSGLLNGYGTTTSTTSEAYNPYTASASGALSTYGATQDPYLALLGGLAGLF